MPEQRLSVGRIVHFKLPDGQVRPAIVVRVWGEQGQGVCNGECGKCGDCANLVVLTDGWNDRALFPGSETNCAVWMTSVMRGDKPGQWNWPARVN